MERYRRIRKLGQGAFGEVVLASVIDTGELVALKHIYVKSAEDGIPDNIVREIKALQAVEHPNVVSLYDFYPRGATMVLVQEYCITDLSKLLRAVNKPLLERQLKNILQQVLLGIQACHTAGIMHRDLKPSNVLINAYGYVKLADFGLARPVDAERPQYTHTVATRWYRAPELLYGSRIYDMGVDIWAIGIIFAEMIRLCPVIPGENDIDQLSKMIQVLGDIEIQWPEVELLPDWGKVTFPKSQGTPWTDIIPTASPGAMSLVTKMLRYNPKERPSIQEALADPYFYTEPLPSSHEEIAMLIDELNLDPKAAP